MRPLTDKEEFDGLRNLAQQIFTSKGAVLPAQAFQDRYRSFYLFDFDEIFTSSLWHLVEVLKKTFGDKSVAMLVHDPSPINYYYRHFRKYGALQFERDDTYVDFEHEVRAIPNGSRADALFHIANVLSFNGTSQEWGIWAERAVGVGIVATTTKINLDGIGPTWFSVDEALNELIALNFKEQRVPEGFSRQFRQNYSSP